MKPFEEWKVNVEDHPEEFELGDYRWLDKKSGWSVWVANGAFCYDINSPHGGRYKLSLWDKMKMKSLMGWWVSGSLREGRFEAIAKRSK
jgi:hypothetical protein